MNKMFDLYQNWTEWLLSFFEKTSNLSAEQTLLYSIYNNNYCIQLNKVIQYFS